MLQCLYKLNRLRSSFWSNLINFFFLCFASRRCFRLVLFGRWYRMKWQYRCFVAPLRPLLSLPGRENPMNHFGYLTDLYWTYPSEYSSLKSHDFIAANFCFLTWIQFTTVSWFTHFCVKSYLWRDGGVSEERAGTSVMKEQSRAVQGLFLLYPFIAGTGT